MRPTHACLTASSIALIAFASAASPALAKEKSARSKDSDPRVACIRETEKTFPAGSLSRKLRDRHVESCMSRMR